MKYKVIIFYLMVFHNLFIICWLRSFIVRLFTSLRHAFGSPVLSVHLRAAGTPGWSAPRPEGNPGVGLRREW